MATMAVRFDVQLDWVNQFDTYLAETGLSDKSRKSYQSDLRVFVRYYQQANNQAFDPSLLTSLDLREFRAWSLTQQRCKAATWNHRMAVLQALAAWAQQAGFVNYNTFQGVTRVEMDELAPKWLEPADFKRFMRQVERNVQTARTAFARWQAVRDQAIVALMVYGGLREFEVCNLEAEDITLTERKGSVLIRLGKGEKSREVPLGREARQALALWLAERGDKKPLFPGKKGQALTERGIQKIIEAISDTCGVSCTPHQLRHTFAKRMLNSNTPITYIQTILGHEKLETTARYTKPSAADLAAAVENL